jgi:hypothetical protein
VSDELSDPSEDENDAGNAKSVFVVFEVFDMKVHWYGPG